jgi:putative ABC transport system permease protein
VRIAGLAWRWLRRRPLRTASTIAGIAVGVALVSAALSVDAAASSGASAYAGALDGRADLQVRAFGEGTLSAASVATIAATPGVVATSAQVRRATFATSGGRSLGAVTLIGVDPVADRAMHDEPLASGSALSATDQGGVLLASAWATAHGLAVGSQVSFVGAGGERSLLVRGILADAGPALADGGRVALALGDTARAVFGLEPGSADRVEVRVDPAVGVAEVESRLDAQLTSEPFLLSTTADDAAGLLGATRDLGSALLLVAAIVLFVGALLVSDALAMSVVERTREVGLLRSAGATRGQVHRLVAAEALWLGLLGTAAGLVLGALLTAVLVPIVGSLSGAPVSGGLLDPAATGVAAALGVLVTLAAAVEPAWRAGRVSPVEALRRVVPLAAPTPRLRRLAAAGAVAAVGGLALLVAGGWADAAPGESGGAGAPAGGAAGLAGVVVVLVLLVVAGLLAPAVLRLAGSLVALAASPLRSSLRAEVRLARGALGHDPGRVAVTFVALSLALGLVVALAAIAQGTRQQGQAWIADVAPADLAVVAIAPVPDDFSADLARVPGVTSATPVRLFDVAIAGRRASAMGVDPAAYAALGALTIESGAARGPAFAALQHGGACLVPRSVADRFGIAAGDTVTLRTAQGQEQCQVASIVAHSLPGGAGESVVLSQADAARSLGIAGASLFLVRGAPGAVAGGLRGRLKEAASQYALTVVDRADIGGAVSGALDRTFGLLDVLALAGVVIAALCILDVLAMDVGQRVRELGLLRAAGLTRRQAWRSVVIEAGIIGLGGSILGTAVGLVVAAVALGLQRPAGGGSVVELPWAAIGLAVVLGIAGSMIAAAYPARLASRVEIARALRVE